MNLSQNISLLKQIETTLNDDIYIGITQSQSVLDNIDTVLTTIDNVLDNIDKAAAGASSSSGEPAPQQELREDDADTPSDVDEVAAQQAANEVMQMLRNRQASMRV